MKARVQLNIIRLIVDLAVLNLAFIAAFHLRFLGRPPAENFNSFLALTPWISLFGVLVMDFYGLYSRDRKSLAEQLAALIPSVALTFCAAVGLSFFGRYFAFPRTVLVLAASLHFVFLALWRGMLHRVEGRWLPAKNVLVVGDRVDECDGIAARISGRSGGRLRVAGIAARQGERGDPVHPLLGTIGDVPRLIEETRSHVLILAPGLDKRRKAYLVLQAEQLGVQILLIPDVYDAIVAGSRLTQIDDLPLFEVTRGADQVEYQLVKRLVDIAASLPALILLSPLMALIGILIKLDSPGPALYTQQRVTTAGRTFMLVKFRTMIDGAERHTGPVLASDNDPRITRLGRLLRATRLDELPQLINVLKGDMSLVGPRPERPYFVEQFAREISGYRYRLRVKPGITGLAQVAGKYSTPARDKLIYDILYARSSNLLADLGILLQTIKVVFMRAKAS